jgi:hypothetical protein
VKTGTGRMRRPTNYFTTRQMLPRTFRSAQERSLQHIFSQLQRPTSSEPRDKPSGRSSASTKSPCKIKSPQTHSLSVSTVLMWILIGSFYKGTQQTCEATKLGLRHHRHDRGETRPSWRRGNRHEVDMRR